MERKTLTTFEVAEYCEVTHRTVRQWISDGKLKAYRTPGNHSRIEVDNFVAFLKKYKMPIPEQFVIDDKKRVLIVDDDKTLVFMIKRLLEKQGDFELDFAFDGFEAGKKYVEFKPHLMILDIRMPKMDGYGLLKQVRDDKDRRGIHIIVISGFTEERERKMALTLGADLVLEKPLKSDVFVNHIAELME